MPFGKSNQPKRRHRPRAVEEEVDVEKEREEREDRMNSPLITTVASVIGVFMMLGVAVFAAPYTYGSQIVRYSQGHIDEAKRVLTLGKAERDQADEKVMVDFTTIILPKQSDSSAAMTVVANKCRQGRSKKLAYTPPQNVHDAYKKATRYLTCAMSTEVTRFCDPNERKVLIDQLMEYKERRQNALAYEAFREKAMKVYNMLAEQGGRLPPPPKVHNKSIGEGLDPAMAAQMENLVRLGYLGPSDFGYMGFYVPSEYKASITVGAERYPLCPGKT